MARATPASPSAKFSTCTASTLVIATAWGRTMRDRGVISPSWFMPISKIARSVVAGMRARVSGHADVIVVGFHRPVGAAGAIADPRARPG